MGQNGILKSILKFKNMMNFSENYGKLHKICIM